jgi:hypothetical protein
MAQEQCGLPSGDYNCVENMAFLHIVPPCRMLSEKLAGFLSCGPPLVSYKSSSVT